LGARLWVCAAAACGERPASQVATVLSRRRSGRSGVHPGGFACACVVCGRQPCGSSGGSMVAR
jgi:hypothetical protein